MDSDRLDKLEETAIETLEALMLDKDIRAQDLINACKEALNIRKKGPTTNVLNNFNFDPQTQEAMLDVVKKIALAKPEGSSE